MKHPPLDSAFDYVVDRLMNHGCTPFIGAGISSQATRNGRPWRGQQVSQMLAKIIGKTVARRLSRSSKEDRRICKDCHKAFRRYVGASTISSDKCLLCCLRKALNDGRLAEACETFVWEHGRLGAAAYRELVSRLEIEQFVELDPTPAHRYLAFLAREGLVREIITTNYDCNVEKAYAATFGSTATAQRHDLPVDVVTDLDAYTAHAGHQAMAMPAIDTRHRLKLFKINGCAHRLRTGQDGAESILLTEGQLQDWRHRRWAADLFRVKFRSTSLLFIGFGNEEPQIRHTAQQVLEEYRASHPEEIRVATPKSSASNAPIFRRPNAPIITLYDAFPGFSQRQMVHGYAHWMGLPGADGDALLLGPGGRLPEGTGARAALPADELFRMVYQRVFQRLVAQALESAAGKENSAFVGAVPHVRHLIEDLAQRWRKPIYAASEPLARQSSNPSNSTSASASFRPDLIVLLNLLRHGEDHPGRYTAIRDHQSLVTEIITLVWLLRQAAGNTGDTTVSWTWLAPLVCFQMPDPLHPGTQLRIYVSCHHADVPEQASAFDPMPVPPALNLILGASGAVAKPLSHRLQLRWTDGTRLPLQVAALCWRHIFNPELEPITDPLMDIPKRLVDAARNPTKYLRRMEASLHRRPYLVEVKP